jgi:hypothetical protein
MVRTRRPRDRPAPTIRTKGVIRVLTKRWILACSFIGTAAILQACGSGDGEGASGGGAGKSSADSGTGSGATGGGAGAAGASGSAGEGSGGSGGLTGCAVDSDCTALVPVTDPPGCAVGSCDTAAGTCSFEAKDVDGDGHRAQLCASTDPTRPVAIGDDCDDGNGDVHPGAWDGPADGSNPNRCDDGIDQDCSGSDGNGITGSGASCACNPGDTQTCSEDSGGIPITWPAGQPLGACKYGVRTCEIDQLTGEGTWGNCEGAIAPTPEFCNGGVDDNCRGNGDDDATDKIYFRYDGDNDLHAQKGWSPVLACPDQVPNQVPAECPGGGIDADAGGEGGTDDGGDDDGGGNPACPPDGWRPNIPVDDCDDTEPTAFPGGTEVCDGLDNDCNTLIDDATTAQTWYFDGDEDGHVPNNAATKKQCPNPGLEAGNCGTKVPPCTAKWKFAPLSHADCADGDAARYPGNWDGPEALPKGLVSPGWTWQHFTRTSTTYNTPPTATETPSTTGTATQLDRDWGYYGGNYWVERWTGTLSVNTAGAYTFHALADDGVRVWIGTSATPLIDGWTNGAATTRSGTRNLSAGSHVIRVEYYEYTGAAQLRLEWSGPGVARQVLREKDDTTPSASRCDAVDQNCNGAADDDLATSPGATRGCTMPCQPGQAGRCEGLNTSGQANVGECNNGLRVCGSTGIWSATCNGYKNPSTEICDTKDNDCDGSVDENTLFTYYFDGDNDGYGALGWASRQACSAPTTCPAESPSCNPVIWKQNIPATDCHDGDSNIHPGLADGPTANCDGKNNDCSGGTDSGCNCVDGQTRTIDATTQGRCGSIHQTCSSGNWATSSDQSWDKTCPNGWSQQVGSTWACEYNSGAIDLGQHWDSGSPGAFLANGGIGVLTYGVNVDVTVNGGYAGGGCWSDGRQQVYISCDNGSAVWHGNESPWGGNQFVSYTYWGAGPFCTLTRPTGGWSWTPSLQGACGRSFSIQFHATGLEKRCSW